MFLDQFSTGNRMVTFILSHSIALRSNLSKLVTAKGAALYGGAPGDVTHFSKEHLLAARLDLDYKDR